MSTAEYIKFNEELDKSRNLSNIENFYNDWAGRYDETMNNNMAPVNSRSTQLLAKYMEKKDGMTILDIPCGTGLTGQALVETGFTSIDGYDLSEGMIKIAKQKKIYRKLSKGCISDKEKLNCLDQTYDGLICVLGISHGHIEYDNALREFIRVLKPNGYMVYIINLSSYDIIEVLKFQTMLMEQKKVDLVLFEKDKYYEKDEGKYVDCLLCVMKKV